MVATEPEQPTGELEQAEVILGLLLPADQDATALRQPGQRPLHHPSASRMALGSLRPLVTDERNVRLVVVVDAGAPAILVVIALVQAQVLRVVRLGLRPF